MQFFNLIEKLQLRAEDMISTYQLLKYCLKNDTYFLFRLKEVHVLLKLNIIKIFYSLFAVYKTRHFLDFLIYYWG